MSPNEFKEFVKKECDLYNVKFIEVDAKSVDKCAGYFLDYDTPTKYLAELVICMKKPSKEWLPILAHEYCHLCQWRNDIKVWRDLSYPNNINSCGEIWHYLEHPYSKVDNIEEHFINVRKMELNCDRRTVSLIQKLGLKVDLDSYKRMSFSYIHLYNYALQFRKWPKRGHMPYSHKEVWSKCPASLNGDFKKAPDYYIDLLNQYCF